MSHTSWCATQAPCSCGWSDDAPPAAEHYVKKGDRIFVHDPKLDKLIADLEKEGAFISFSFTNVTEEPEEKPMMRTDPKDATFAALQDIAARKLEQRTKDALERAGDNERITDAARHAATRKALVTALADLQIVEADLLVERERRYREDRRNYEAEHNAAANTQALAAKETMIRDLSDALNKANERIAEMPRVQAEPTEVGSALIADLRKETQQLHDNLTVVQRRCTQLLEEKRELERDRDEMRRQFDILARQNARIREALDR